MQGELEFKNEADEMLAGLQNRKKQFLYNYSVTAMNYTLSFSKFGAKCLSVSVKAVR